MPWKPEDWEKFNRGYQEQAGNAPASSGGGSSGGGLGADLLGATSATITGMGKGLAQMGAPPGGVSLNEADPKGPVATWAGTEDQRYPIAEKAGRYAAEYGPLAALPDVGAPGAFAKAVPELPRLARIAGKGAEGLWKGGVGGYTQGNPKAGAATGGGTAAAAATLKEFPQIMWPAGFAAIEAAREGGLPLPWGAWHLAHPLAALAALVAGKAPGVAGALGAEAVGRDDGQDR